jgi:hypothetical protein
MLLKDDRQGSDGMTSSTSFDRRLVSMIAIVIGIIVIVAIGILETRSAAASAKPIVVIDSPASNSEFQAGSMVAVQSTSTDPTGISRVELLVDGTVIHTDAPPQPSTSFTVLQTWLATAGTHTLTVRAFSEANVESNPVEIVVNVLLAPTPTPTATATPTLTPTATATATATPTLAPTATPPPGCTNSAVFVTDVTVPDGTALAPGQAFDKIWRVFNTGTCTWNSGYTFTFVGGTLMGTVSAISVPGTGSRQTADLSVPMIAPTTPGTFTGYWRMRTPTGVYFGPGLNVTISIPAPTPAACSGVPVISSFIASPATIVVGQSTTLSWGLVGNATDAEIDQGIGGIATPGSITVSPATTTTYTLTAHCGSNVQIAQATVFVVPPPTATPVPTNTPTPLPTFTPTPLPTATPQPTPTNTPTPPPTHTPTPAPTNTPTLAPTNTPTLAPTNTPTLAPTNTPTPAPTNTPTLTPTPRSRA